MPKQLLVRNISKEVSDWIEEERHQYNMTQQELITGLPHWETEFDIINKK